MTRRVVQIFAVSCFLASCSPHATQSNSDPQNTAISGSSQQVGIHEALAKGSLVVDGDDLSPHDKEGGDRGFGQ
jgi:hypothetical protein